MLLGAANCRLCLVEQALLSGWPEPPVRSSVYTPACMFGYPLPAPSTLEWASDELYLLELVYTSARRFSDSCEFSEELSRALMSDVELIQ